MDIGRLPLSKLTFVSVDTETTGLRYKEDRILEVAALRFRYDGEVLGHYSTLIHQDEEVPAEITAINNITRAMTQGALREVDALWGFQAFCSEQSDGLAPVLVAHNAPFDIRFLDYAFQEHSLARIMAKVLDSQLVAKAIYPVWKLQKLVERLQLPQHGEAHRALADCFSVMELLRRVFAGLDPDDTLVDVPGAVLFPFDHAGVGEVIARIGGTQAWTGKKPLMAAGPQPERQIFAMNCPSSPCGAYGLPKIEWVTHSTGKHLGAYCATCHAWIQWLPQQQWGHLAPPEQPAMF